MLRIERLRDIRTNDTTRAFFISNRQGKTIAMGAVDRAGPLADPGFLLITCKRYARDADLVNTCERLSGLSALNRIK